MSRLISSESPRIFDNALLERFSRAHPRLPIFMFMPVVVALGWFALRDMPAWRAISAALLGYFLWTLLEYFGHRQVFHWVPPGKLGARLHFLIHGVHHDYPNDPWRLVMPPLMSLPVLGIAAALIWAVCGAPYFAPVLAGFGLGYIAYDTLHYELHHREQRTRLGKWLKRRHMLHHFRDPTRGFGISCPWLDFAFGTLAREKSDAP